MNKNDFCNIHTHGVNSHLDGYSTPERLVRRTVELGQKAIGLTDHGNMAGVMNLKMLADKEGLITVIGNEFYMAPMGKNVVDHRPGRDERHDSSYHLTAWCYNQEGYQNMLKLTQMSNKIGFHYNPRIDQYMLEKYNKGIIITSGCLASYVSQGFVQRGKNGSQFFSHTNESTRRVHDFFGWAYDVFGHDRFFVEVQDHDMELIRLINREIHIINKKYFQFEYLATNDSHYVSDDDVDGHTALISLNSRCTLSSPNSFVSNFASHPDYYLTSYDQMKAKNYGFDAPDSAITNNVKIANMVEKIYLGYEPEVKQYRFPVMPEFEDDYNKHLTRLSTEGFESKYGYSKDDTKAGVRLAKELAIISDLGFASYFLCVYDIKTFCDERRIPMTVRGSAGGSIVLYCLGVTDFCPIEYDLIFERFLNPDRVSAPDADIDLAPTRRKEVVDYLIDKYGRDYVAQVSAFGYIGVRGAIRDATRLNDEGFDTGTRLLRKIFGAEFDSEVFESEEVSEETEKKDIEKFLEYVQRASPTDIESKILDTATALHGQLRNVSIHAGAFLLSNRPLYQDYPMIRPKTTSSNLTELIVNIQYTKAEMLGGIKLDLLNVDALAILYDAIERINIKYSKNYTFETIPVDDPKSYDLLNSGDLSEIFQLSGFAARPVVQIIKPRNVRDVMVCNSICRPGPAKYAQVFADRMHGKEIVTYKHPDLEGVLSETFGICLFQEDIMRVSQTIAGFTGAQADILRKACSKKEGDDFDKVSVMFFDGARKKGYSDEVINGLWDDILEFSGYGFNAAHSCSYARIAVKQAYLKAHYPIEYYAAALTGRISKEDKLKEILFEMKRSSIEVLGPSLGYSDPEKFSIDYETMTIRFPYASVKNVGKAGDYLKHIDLDDIDLVTDAQLKLFKKAGKRSLESLAIVGAFDHLFPTRNHAVRDVEFLSKGLPPIRQASFLPEKDMYTRAEFYALERELTGLYLTGHPLDKYDLYDLKNQIPFDQSEVYETMHDSPGMFVGVVHSIRLHRDRKNNIMAFVKIEDKEYNTMSVVVFASVYEEVQDSICVGCVCKVLGKINVRWGRDEEEEAKLKKYGRVSIVAATIIGE